MYTLSAIYYPYQCPYILYYSWCTFDPTTISYLFLHFDCLFYTCIVHLKLGMTLLCPPDIDNTCSH